MISIASPALAQESPVSAPSGQAVEEPDVVSETDIIVTARRCDERLQDLPVSLTAFSAGALERSTVQEHRSINVLTPGLTFANEGGAGNATLSLRGIGQIPLG